MSRLPLLRSLALLLAGGACLSLDACSKQESAEKQAAVLASAPQPSASASVHSLRCGCDIESVGTCGEYIEVDGAFVPLKLPVDLGSMPFCGHEHLRAKVDGHMENGTFVATSFAYVE